MNMNPTVGECESSAHPEGITPAEAATGILPSHGKVPFVHDTAG